VNKAVGIQIRLRRVAPNDQGAQLYADPKAFISEIVSYVREGLMAGETILIVASAQNLLAVQNTLRAEGFDLFFMSLRGQFITFDAEDLLDKFMINDWPDETLFKHLIVSLSSRAFKNDKNVRVFTEMAALLYQKGYRAASVQLERMWIKLLKGDGSFPNVTLVNETIPPSSVSDETIPSFLRQP
jgi:hypothetical protein